MTLRGKAAIVGMAELPTRRTYPGRTTTSLCTEAARMAIADAGLHMEDVDGLITPGSDVSPMDLAEYTGLHVGFCEDVTQHGSRGAHAVVAAAAAIHAGLAHTVPCVFGGTRDPAVGGFGPGVVRGMPPRASATTDQGRFPVNTDGGQISAGQPVGGAGRFRQVIEAAHQVMGRAGQRQVAKRDLGMGIG
jgi:acetyl-CoA acetyltransferase